MIAVPVAVGVLVTGLLLISNGDRPQHHPLVSSGLCLQAAAVNPG